MSEYIYKVGDDFESDDKEYVALKTDKGQQITVALGVSGVPFKGRFDKESIFFSYDSDYKDTVQEIMEKITSDKYADQRDEIEKHRREKDYLFFIPAVAEILRMTEGTLRRRPLDIQLAVCKRYADIWGCDTYTIQHKLRDAMMLIIKPELTDSDKEKAVGKD
ncbi:hypothetical protein [Ruminococcus albus]|uniref:Uncharacterized protein n=1 Tax=Ruminococcus albus TaxID=1264 RepID=A0A1I1FPZ3_RUMAL|nr:hypothetical protein [Ruminococcus albus]SFC01629.1 hypothetical protein SAMN02910406_00986 [Ruminococcus albus]